MLAAGLLFAFMDAGMKWISNDYSPFQVATLRSLSALPLVLAWILLRGRAGTLLRVHWGLHLLRGLLGVGMMVGFVYGLARMPLSTNLARRVRHFLHDPAEWARFPRRFTPSSAGCRMWANMPRGSSRKRWSGRVRQKRRRSMRWSRGCCRG